MDKMKIVDKNGKVKYELTDSNEIIGYCQCKKQISDEEWILRKIFDEDMTCDTCKLPIYKEVKNG